MSRYHFKNLHTEFGDKKLFSNLDLTIEGFVGVVGRNGSGKTCLLLEITRRCQDELGLIVGRLEQVVDDSNDIATLLGVSNILGALERMAAGVGTPADLDIIGERWDIVDEINGVLSRYNLNRFNLRSATGALSGGQRVLFQIVRTFLQHPDVLILDEPTNNLDRGHKQQLLQMLQDFPGPVVVASHDRELLQNAQHIVEIDKGVIYQYGGNFDLYYEKREEAFEKAAQSMELALKKKKDLKLEIQKSKEKAHRRSKSGKRDIAKGSHGRSVMNLMKETASQSMQRRGILSEARTKDVNAQIANAETLRKRSESMRIGFDFKEPNKYKVLVSCLNLGLKFADFELFKELNLQIFAGDHLALDGPNGSGKSSLLELITGGLAASEGEIYNSSKKTVYIDQTFSLLQGNQTVLQHFQKTDWSTEELRFHLASFLFKNDSLNQLVSSLSGGEKMRLCMALAFVAGEAVDLMILDEPTNHMDLESIIMIEQSLCDYKGTLIVVSHDEDFKNNLNLKRVEMQSLMFKVGT